MKIGSKVYCTELDTKGTVLAIQDRIVTDTDQFVKKMKIYIPTYKKDSSRVERLVLVETVDGRVHVLDFKTTAVIGGL